MGFTDVLDASLDTAQRFAEERGAEELLAGLELVAAHRHRARTRDANPCPLPDLRERLPPGVGTRSTVVEALADGLDTLAWFRSEKVPAEFRSQSCASELIGPDGAIDAVGVRFGLFFIDAGAFYARHWHPAEEHYLVATGAGDWNLDEGWFTMRPGDVLRIPSMTPHTIRTGSDAVLTLYLWTGDTSFDGYVVSDD